MSKIFTFGCRLNFYESEIIREHLNNINRDDIVVVHSCAVTNEAERQVKQKIRNIYHSNSEAKIIVVGCATQLNPHDYINIPGVVKVLGNHDKLKYENYFIDNNKDNVIVNKNLDSVDKIPFKSVGSFFNKSRAFIEIQNGCNHSCTFCIITKARGMNRSSPIEDIIKKISVLVDNGYNEVVLTGVDITDYGQDIYGKNFLGGLIKEILKSIPNLERLRLSSIDIAEIDEQLLDIIINEMRVMPHLHLSVQSGNNLILKRMKRRHSREQVIKFCNIVRKHREGIALGADIITGFPTETEYMFNETVGLVKETGMVYLHIFPYSEKKGTPAALMPQVSIEIRKNRAERLRKIANNQLLEFYSSLLHTKQRVLLEKNNTGHCENFAFVKLEHVPSFVRQKEVIDVCITSVKDNFLFAEMC